MFNFLFPMLVIKALEPDRDTRDLVLGGMLGATVAGGSAVGGLVGRELLDRMSPLAAVQGRPPAVVPVKPELPPPGQPDTITFQVPAADKALDMVKIAAAGAMQAYKQDRRRSA